MNPDVELLARSVARDPRAFGDLFDRHSTAVFRFAFSLSHNETEAQEVVQETFITAWRKLADIRLAGDSMLPWLLVTARNHHRNRVRAALRAGEAMPLDDYRGDRDAHAREAERVGLQDELDWVFAAIRTLSPVDQRIVDLCLYEGLSYNEAAMRLGLTAQGVGKRLERTRARLRSMRDAEAAEAAGEVRR